MNQQMHRAPGTPRKLLDQVRDLLRGLHYSLRTEQAYFDWIRRYIHFHGKRHPVFLGATEMEAFLTALAVDRRVATSTQSQALSALLLHRLDLADGFGEVYLPHALTHKYAGAACEPGWQYVFPAPTRSVAGLQLRSGKYPRAHPRIN
jgi:hypothetical protein